MATAWGRDVIETAASDVVFGQQTSIAVGGGVVHVVYWQLDGQMPGTVRYARADLPP